MTTSTYIVVLENRERGSKQIVVSTLQEGESHYDTMVTLSALFDSPRVNSQLLGHGTPSFDCGHGRVFFTQEQADWYSCGWAGAPFMGRDDPFLKKALSELGFIDCQTQEEKMS